MGTGGDERLTVEEKRTLIREVAADEGAVFLDVAGVSMEPLARVGDRLGIVPVLPDELRVGDVMAYDENNQTVCHRFLGWKKRNGKRYARQRGDNISAGSLVEPGRIFGRVAFLECGGRRIDLDRPLARALARAVGRYLSAYDVESGGSALRRRLQRAVTVPLDRLIRRC